MSDVKNTVTDSEILIDVRNLQKSFGDKVVLTGVTTSIKNGEKVAVIGPSGSGKSTLLNIIGGIDSLSSGKINMNDNIKIGYMLQDDCLFPWLNILDNCLIGLKNIKKTVII